MKQTFVIEVIDQQNASWQGTVNWVNKGKKENFRSVLELIRLMDSALESEKKESEEKKGEE